MPALDLLSPVRRLAFEPVRAGQLRSRWRVLAQLTKFWITMLSTLSAAGGYVVFCHRLDSGALTLSLGVLLTAMGAAAMNQFQDRALDARMERTRSRPLPAGTVRPCNVVAISLILMTGGILILWTRHNATSAALGLAAVAWYNVVYTYVKRIWAFAVVPGALIGALPPVIGWAAGGGSPFAPPILALAFFLFMWQVPHFWLLLFRFGDDYARAGLPSLTKVFTGRQLARITRVWMLATVASSLMLPMYKLVTSSWAMIGLMIAGLWLAWESAELARNRRPADCFHQVFRSINIYALTVMALLAADALV